MEPTENVALSFQDLVVRTKTRDKKNLLVVEGRYRFDNGLNVIMGSSGAGKTTLLNGNGICAVLMPRETHADFSFCSVCFVHASNHCNLTIHIVLSGRLDEGKLDYAGVVHLHGMKLTSTNVKAYTAYVQQGDLIHRCYSCTSFVLIHSSFSTR